MLQIYLWLAYMQKRNIHIFQFRKVCSFHKSKENEHFPHQTGQEAYEWVPFLFLIIDGLGLLGSLSLLITHIAHLLNSFLGLHASDMSL